MTYIVHHGICTKLHTRIKLGKRFKHRAFSNTSYQKDILHVRYIHGENNKTLKRNV